MVTLSVVAVTPYNPRGWARPNAEKAVTRVASEEVNVSNPGTVGKWLHAMNACMVVCTA